MASRAETLSGKSSMVASTPFVLLDDASGERPARLYHTPADTICAQVAEEFRAALTALDTARISGQHAVGYFSYEAGLALEPRLKERLAHYLAREDAGSPPLCWFGLFADYEEIPGAAVDQWLAEKSGAQSIKPSQFTPQQSLADYQAQFATIINAIHSGDIYQANLTIRSVAHFDDCPVALYRALRSAGAARYSALLFDGTHWMLSFSPELFFACRDGRITTRPMKGTLPARPDIADDAEQALTYFASDSKNRAENLMIVDLLRNDLSRICVPGSVTTRDLFAVEHYPTVHQMVSTISGQMQPETGIADIISALFPCGSITGAPKIRAMEIIDAIEPAPRGVYCGAIGRIDAGEALSAAFNVAIRTLHFAPALQKLTLGLGSGVVADSDAQSEWQECLDKGAFTKGGVCSDGG